MIWAWVLSVVGVLLGGFEVYALVTDRIPTLTRFIQRYTKSWAWGALAVWVAGTGAIGYHLFIDL